MAEKTFHVDVVSPVRTIFSGPVVYLQVMAWDGYLGVLANHAPLLEQLGYGDLRLTVPEGLRESFVINGGFMEVSKERTVVLADAVERVEEIDTARALAALDRAQSRLTDRLETPNFDPLRAEAALKRALNRLKAAGAPEAETFRRH